MESGGLADHSSIVADVSSILVMLAMAGPRIMVVGSGGKLGFVGSVNDGTVVGWVASDTDFGNRYKAGRRRLRRVFKPGGYRRAGSVAGCGVPTACGRRRVRRMRSA